MATNVTLRDANHNFAKYVRAVQSGKEFVITRRGQPVARLAPVAARRALSPEQDAIHRRLMRRLRKGWPIAYRRIDRDLLHER